MSEVRRRSQSFASSDAVRQRMQRQARRDTSSELAVRRLLHFRGLRYRVDIRPLPALRRRADIVFTRAKVAVFIDGCYWHGCPQHRSFPHTNAPYWAEKIARNQARDRDTDLQLLEVGWTVVRVWEHEDVRAAADRIELLVRRSQRPR